MPADLDVYMEQSEDKSYNRIKAAESIYRIEQKTNGGYKEEYIVLLRTPWYVNND